MSMSMTSISDLPNVAVKHIIQLARGRIFDGVNSCACVCQQWRDAGSSSSEGSEQLQLFLDLADMSEAAVARSLAWLAKHGKQTGVLVVVAGLPRGVHQDTLYTSVASLSNLRRLEAHQEHSLVRLAPVLKHLPQLQHLEAHVAMACHPAGGGIFVDQTWRWWPKVPALRQQLDPQLTHLRLLVEPVSDGLWLDGRLPRLLPASLQHLQLVGVGRSPFTGVSSRFLSHLTSLQQRTLHEVQVGVEESHGVTAAVAEDLPALQQLQVTACRLGCTLADNELLQALAPKITDYSSLGYTF
jgi:hypothetical protein